VANSDKVSNVLYNPTQAGITWNNFAWELAAK